MMDDLILLLLAVVWPMRDHLVLLLLAVVAVLALVGLIAWFMHWGRQQRPRPRIEDTIEALSATRGHHRAGRPTAAR